MAWHDKEKQRAYNQRYMKQYRLDNLEKLRDLNAAWRKANPDVVRKNNLKLIGFTPALFNEALVMQGHRCPICEVDFKTLPTKHVHGDHCHDTRMPRGILCHGCNTGLGALGDDIERLRRAIAYLENPPLSLV